MGRTGEQMWYIRSWLLAQIIDTESFIVCLFFVCNHWYLSGESSDFQVDVNMSMCVRVGWVGWGE